jgi:vancomycin resistance protein YoaR
MLKRPLRIAALLLAILGVIVLGGWGVSALGTSGKSARSISVVGVGVGGRSARQVTERLSQLDRDLGRSQIQISVGSQRVEASASEFGISVDVPATTDLVMHANRPAPVVGWIGGLFTSGTVNPVLRFSEPAARATIDRLNDSLNAKPVQPRIAPLDGRFTVVPGTPGQGVDADDVVRQLRVLRPQRGVMSLSSAVVPVAPSTPVASLQPIADEANAMTASAVTVSAGTATTELSPAQLRSWVTVTGEPPAIGIDTGRVNAELEATLKAGVTKPVDASIVVAFGKPIVVPAVDGQLCCDPSAPTTLLDALRKHTTTPIVLPTVAVPAKTTTEDLNKLGIVELVSTFTTRHKPNEARVTNIHLAADILRGTIIPAGGRLSLNTALGSRTAAKGFVIAPTIQDGDLVPAVGGGVSQLATTTFNAAFFAGLEFGEYQSHSLYISRYPFGREATVNLPSPDLVIKNPTSHAVMIWTSYTGTSLTVELYSTKYVTEVHQGNQTASVAGLSCVLIKTERVLTYVDGTTKTDSVRARYRAMEKLDCNQPLPPGAHLQNIPGKPPLPAPAGGAVAATTTTVAPTTTTPGSAVTPAPTTTTTSAPAATTTTAPPATTAPPPTSAPA